MWNNTLLAKRRGQRLRESRFYSCNLWLRFFGQQSIAISLIHSPSHRHPAPRAERCTANREGSCAKKVNPRVSQCSVSLVKIYIVTITFLNFNLYQLYQNHNKCGRETPRWIIEVRPWQNVRKLRIVTFRQNGHPPNLEEEGLQSFNVDLGYLFNHCRIFHQFHVKLSN